MENTSSSLSLIGDLLKVSSTICPVCDKKYKQVRKGKGPSVLNHLVAKHKGYPVTAAALEYLNELAEKVQAEKLKKYKSCRSPKCLKEFDGNEPEIAYLEHMRLDHPGEDLAVELKWLERNTYNGSSYVVKLMKMLQLPPDTFLTQVERARRYRSKKRVLEARDSLDNSDARFENDFEAEWAKEMAFEAEWAKEMANGVGYQGDNEKETYHTSEHRKTEAEIGPSVAAGSSHPSQYSELLKVQSYDEGNKQLAAKSWLKRRSVDAGFARSTKLMKK